jgi:hypothetical protein
VTHPYRTPPRDPDLQRNERRLGVASFAFAFLCVVGGEALAKEHRSECALLATAAGVFLLARRRIAS